MIGRLPVRRLRDHLARNAQRWMRPLLVTGLFLLSITQTILASQRQLMLLLLPLVGVGMVLTFLRWPPLGLVVASVAGLVVPYLGPSGINVTIILVALLFGLWLLDMVTRLREGRLVNSRTTWPLLAFTASAMLSFSMGQLRWFTFAPHAPLGAQLGGLSIALLSAGAFLLMANRVRDLGWLKGIVWVFLAVGALSFVGRSILPELGLPTRELFPPVGSLFYVWLVAMALSQAVFNRELRPGWRIALGGLVVTALLVLSFLKFADKSGWIPALVCAVAVIAFRSWRTGLVLGPAAGLVIYLLATRLIGADEYSLTTRLEAWSILAQIIKANPVWGLGFANYYWYTPLFPIRGYPVSFNSHNNYVDIVAQTGLLGLVSFVWFLGEVGRLGWRLRERVPDGFARAYVYGALGGLVGMAVAGMLGDWVLPFFYNIGLNGFRSSMLGWLFLGGLVSLERMAISRKSRK